MSIYDPPTENTPIFNSSFWVAGTTTLTKDEADDLYLSILGGQTVPLTETFGGGIETNTIEPYGLSSEVLNITTTGQANFGGSINIPTGSEYLINNVPVETLPSQTGNSGKYLTTDGTDPSWSEVTSVGTLSSLTMGGDITLKTSGSNPTASTQLGGLTTVSVSSTTLSNGSIPSQVASVSIPFGVYQVNIVVQFRCDNYSNFREKGISFITTSASVPIGNSSSILNYFSPITVGGTTFDYLSFSRVIQLTATTTYYLNAFITADSGTIRTESSGSTVQITRIG